MAISHMKDAPFLNILYFVSIPVSIFQFPKWFFSQKNALKLLFSFLHRSDTKRSTFNLLPISIPRNLTETWNGTFKNDAIGS